MFKMASKVETNFMRLLSRCETMAAEKTRDWRLEKYIDALQNQLGELRRSPSKPNQEVLANYNRKVEFLRGLLEAETMLTSTDKAAATQKLNPGRNSSQNGSTPQTKELHLQAKARYESEMRDELLGKSSSQQDRDGVRQRKAVEEEEDDIDAVMQQHHKMQQKIADEMVLLTRSLKENASMAGKIIREDTKKIGESHKLADTNFSKLKVESERLEAHTKTSCNWWIWIMIVLVILTFLWMVLFMRMFPKR